jgi:membrane protein YdbS with pleckstrin-like domain
LTYIGFLLVAITTNGISYETFRNGSFLFALTLMMPLYAIGEHPEYPISLAVAVIIVILILRLVSAPYRWLVYWAAFAGWVVLGFYSIVFVTGGA